MFELSTLKEVFAIAANATIVVGAVGAVIKYRLLNVFGHRWVSALKTTDRALTGGTSLFVAEYTLSNTGQRPLQIETVSLRLLPVRREEGALLKPDRASVLVDRQIPDDVGTRGNLDVQPGEVSTFTLRCELDRLPELAFVECAVSFRHKRVPAVFVGFHCRAGASERDSSPCAGAGRCGEGNARRTGSG